LSDRKAWIDNRLRELAEIFSVSVAGFSVLDNHLHVLVRLEPEVAKGWSDEDVVRRWGGLFPPRDKSLTKGRLFGRFFAASRALLREVAERLGLRRVPNLGGCPAT